MSVTVTAADVEAIIEVDSTISLTPFIEAAVAMVEKNCEEKNSAYTAAELTRIAKWLAAHFYTVRDPRSTRDDVGRGVGSWYQSAVDLGLNTSHYGQMAMRLDWYGGLSVLDAGIKTGGKRTIGITSLRTEDETLEE